MAWLIEDATRIWVWQNSPAVEIPNTWNQMLSLSRNYYCPFPRRKKIALIKSRRKLGQLSGSVNGPLVFGSWVQAPHWVWSLLKILKKKKKFKKSGRRLLPANNRKSIYDRPCCLNDRNFPRDQNRKNVSLSLFFPPFHMFWFVS